MRSPARDVVIIGAGVAGLALGILLRRDGFTVECVDAQPYPHSKVGESLDWSSPALLASLGITTDELLAADVATPKNRILVSEREKPVWTATPPAALRRRPLRFETATLHVDREAVDARVWAKAAALGVTFAYERVVGIESDRDRVTACTTADGRRLTGRWFVDATGTGRVFGRLMKIPVVNYGRPKVCLWAYFDTPPLHDGTTFFADNRDEYLSWIWDIPISSRRTSVGIVVPATTVRDRRRAGESIETIFCSMLGAHSRFATLLDHAPAVQVRSTAFQPYVSTRVCGGNWLMVGEAASMPDPLTGNGFTSGIRHARHAAAAIRNAADADALTPRQRRGYERHVFRLGHSFNAHIECALYQPDVRRGFGLRTAAIVYTFFAFFMNALHARFNPRGNGGMALFAVLFAAARTWIAAWVWAGRGMRRLRAV